MLLTVSNLTVISSIVFTTIIIIVTYYSTSSLLVLHIIVVIFAFIVVIILHMIIAVIDSHYFIAEVSLRSPCPARAGSSAAAEDGVEGSSTMGASGFRAKAAEAFLECVFVYQGQFSAEYTRALFYL